MMKQLLSFPAKFTGDYSTFFTVIALTLLISATIGDKNGATEEEIESMISSLRSNGYDLFATAIASSYLRFHILSGGSYTLFSPPDFALRSLHESSHASVYLQTLHYHVAPRRLACSNLRNRSALFVGPYLDTLLPRRSLLVVNGTVLDDIMVDGVRVSVPDLYLGANIAVHGLDGIFVVAGKLGFASPVNAMKKQRKHHGKPRHGHLESGEALTVTVDGGYQI
ncbi:hypothetical protein RJ640_012541 [Escallonia rubra]|uniref:FAS1 domain-containing protein n=1 Tax=Escallonia rubra TaxID=112253 RepID=A0AA88S1V7_9ASTE|nr:hypothetical protein RJ640_012541 [Escallonia rubra]